MSCLNSILEDLLTSLDKETALYQDLLLLLQREKEAVVGRALDDLNKSNKKKETLILQARVFEEARLVMLDKLGKQTGIPSNKLTLSYLSDVVEEPYSTRLKAHRSNLLSLFHSIQDINRVNEGLISHSLDCIAGSWSLLSNMVSSGSIYLDTGQIQNGNKNGRLIRGRI